jgi:UDP-2,4-diacetamido-2,4,6-trideoxy-beta-L-altropyranose hydrolase
VPIRDTSLLPLEQAAWLGYDWQTDAEQTGEVLARLQPEWLITDHYALGQPWEIKLEPSLKRLMVIDDLADRNHCCDVLLDQNWFGINTTHRYLNLVPHNCKCFLGPNYALLRPEYAKLRANLLPRDGMVRRILVFLGGSDLTNQTSKVLQALMHTSLKHLQVDVVIGQNHPDKKGIAVQVATRPGTTLHQALPSLAALMVRADLMIGAGGSTTWERFCLGLPSIVISVASNQTSTNTALMKAGYIDFLGVMNEVSVSCVTTAVQRSLANPEILKTQSCLSQELVKGLGVQTICEKLLGQ